MHSQPAQQINHKHKHDSTHHREQAVERSLQQARFELVLVGDAQEIKQLFHAKLLSSHNKEHTDKDGEPPASA